MSTRETRPIWFELLARDADAAQSFYTHAVGWSAASSGQEGVDYRILSAPDGDNVAGLMTNVMPDAPPGWLVYFGVPDVDRSVTEIADAGGTVQMPAVTMEGVGRMAMVTDTQGASFYVMKGESDEESRAFLAGEHARPGHGVWIELTSPDPAAAITFYRDQLGIRQQGAMPMGELGDYSFLHAGPIAIGAVMPSMASGQDGWMPYFHQSDIDATCERVKAGGGAVLQGPDQIPGGDYAVVARDPQGARFGVVGPRLAAG